MPLLLSLLLPPSSLSISIIQLPLQLAPNTDRACHTPPSELPSPLPRDSKKRAFANFDGLEPAPATRDLRDLESDGSSEGSSTPQQLQFHPQQRLERPLTALSPMLLSHPSLAQQQHVPLTRTHSPLTASSSTPLFFSSHQQPIIRGHNKAGVGTVALGGEERRRGSVGSLNTHAVEEQAVGDGMQAYQRTSSVPTSSSFLSSSPFSLDTSAAIFPPTSFPSALPQALPPPHSLIPHSDARTAPPHSFSGKP